MRKTLSVLLTVLALTLGTSALAAAATPAYKVTLTASRSTADAGTFLTLSGKVTGPKAAGKSVTIQRHYVGTSWVTVTTATIKSDGTFKARVETPRGGTTSFRVLKAKSSVRKAGTSPTRSLKVYEWLYLANEAGTLQSGRIFQPSVEKIGDTTYTRSMSYYNGDADTFYKLSGLCTSFTTRANYRLGSNVGVLDAMDVVLTRTTDKGISNVGTTTVQLNSPTTITAPLTGIKYLDLTVTSIGSDYYGLLGNPRVRCNADHLPSFDATDN